MEKKQAKMIKAGNKKVVVVGEELKGISGKPLCFIGGNVCYGVLSLSNPKKIDLKEFKRLEPKHKIVEEEREALFGEKDVFYAYDLKLIHIFEEPRLVEAPLSAKVGVVEPIEFLKIESEEKKDESKKMHQVSLMEHIPPMMADKKFYSIDEMVNFMYG
ncbi:MAG: hypothetical protein ACTSPI_12005, partial [Candidatus Heimdallarchaeaceae archaeon]